MAEHNLDASAIKGTGCGWSSDS
ncbi:hypothetical protein OIU92_08495 [Escherichia coli]|nr:hypothetical protein [Escherichia coli]